ncbi:hypothetical protein KFK09_018072 [Dendrobium nobile]|uniref:Mitochondrial protein n=1 Tax=Dendrobium nobile TaxID=94219 RepID=A0A8T3AUY1_DENNO|nr:hypothetical protein KFK09_018072 [Dendrobium nobile]
MMNCKPVSTPIATKQPKSGAALASTEFYNPQLYRQIVGSLQYLTLTRPEISYAVNKACQHMHQPSNHHFEDLKQILRYIHGSLNIGLPLYQDSLHLTSYVDADRAGDQTDHKSTTGYCNFLGNTLISWCVKKQATVAQSSTKAEDRALASTATDII